MTEAATIGPYRILATIARGGMGVVYRAQEVRTGRLVALKTAKVLRAHNLEGLRRETRALERLAHPGVVRILGQGLHEGVPWCAMELLEGSSLRQRMRSFWTASPVASPGASPGPSLGPTVRLPTAGSAALDATPETTTGDAAAPGPAVGEAQRRGAPAAGGHLVEALTLACRLCQTLSYLHGEGVVHRDLKPENVILVEEGLPVVVDFGITRRFAGAGGREVLELHAEASGTVAYMAPEQIQGLDTDARTDLYALGAILFEMLCGAPPFVHDPQQSVLQQHLARQPPRPSACAAGIPFALDALVMQLLAKAPRDRPGYADDVGHALQRLGGRPHPRLSAPPRAYLYRPPFVGRADLCATLERELDEAAEGRGRVALVTGPSGSGKTRLAMEAARSAHRAGMAVVSGDSALFGAAEEGAAAGRCAPFQPLGPLFLWLVDRCRVEGATVSRALLGAHARVLEAYEPAFAGLPGCDDLDPPVPLPAPSARERAQLAAAEVIRRAAQRWPLLLVVDDLQWADDLTLGALEMLVRAAEAPLRALVLLTCRSESMTGAVDVLRRAPRTLSLRLDRLEVADVGAIVAGMTARDLPPASFTRELAEQSGGNPFFVAEYLKAAVAEGLLHRTEGQWRLPEGSESGFDAWRKLRDLGSIHALMERRLDRLGEAARRAVESGAVLGRELDAAVVAAVADLGDDRAPDAIDELLLRQILEEAEGGRLRFAHDKIRETAYARVEPERRRRLHLRAAEVIGRAGDDPASYRVLAHHFKLAGATDQALTYATLAGRRALAEGSYPEARGHLEAALELHRGRAAAAPLDHARLLRLLAEALNGSGEADAAGGRALEAMALLRPAGAPRSRAGWARTLVVEGLEQAARRALPSAWLAADASARPRFEEAAGAASQLLHFYLMRNEMLEAVTSVLLTCNLSERAAARLPLSRAQVALGATLGLMKLPGPARRYFAASRENARAAGDFDARMHQAEVEGFYHLHRASFAAAEACLEPALGESAAAGFAFHVEAISVSLGILALLRGDLPGAAARAEQLIASALALGHHLNHAWGRLLLGSCQLQRGRFAEVIALLSPLETELGAHRDVANRLNALAILAAARLGLGDVEGAVAGAEEARAGSASAPGANFALYQVHELLPEVHLAAWARAARRGEPTGELARRAAESTRAAERYAWMYATARPFALRHAGLLAALGGGRRRARRLLSESVRVAAHLGIPYQEALSSLELARSAGLLQAERDAALDRAARIFARLGAAFHLGEVEAARRGELSPAR